MADVQDFIKKYWPYILGGVVGLYLLSRQTGSGQPQTVVLGGGGMSDAAYMAQAQMASIEAQSAIDRQMLQMQQTQMDREHTLNLSALEAQTRAASDANLTNYLAAQGAASQGVAQAASGVIAALTAPSIAAINSSTQENAHALMAASQAAGDAYKSIAQINLAASEVAGRFADTTHSAYMDTTAGEVAQAMAAVGKQPTTLETFGGYMTDTFGRLIPKVNTSKIF